MKFGACPITSYVNFDYLQKCMTYLNADTDITYTDWNIPREEIQVDLRKKLKTVLLLKGMDTQKPPSALFGLVSYWFNFTRQILGSCKRVIVVTNFIQMQYLS